MKLECAWSGRLCLARTQEKLFRKTRRRRGLLGKRNNMWSGTEAGNLQAAWRVGCTVGTVGGDMSGGQMA